MYDAFLYNSTLAEKKYSLDSFGLTIEEDGTVTAGSVVTRDVRKGKLVVGVPARKLRNVLKDQLRISY
jgi:acetyltransferase-like isoleucine patch superfamily enzyme